jgi:hypothetical protein
VDDIDIEIIPVPVEAGISSLAFGFKNILADYGEDLTEIAMDSTCVYAVSLITLPPPLHHSRENKCLRLVFEGPVRSGFFPFWKPTETRTGLTTLKPSEKPDRTI